MRLEEVDLLKFGNTIQMAGAVYVGEGKVYLAMFPDEAGQVSRDATFLSEATGGVAQAIATLDMDQDAWVRFLRQTDLLETEILTNASDGKLAKAIVRKSQRQISQGVSWTVFRRDGYRCRYCAANDVPLTVDHLVLWEEGGPSIEANLVSACRRCNKTRGNTQYATWLTQPYYKKASEGLDAETRQANVDLIPTLGSIPRLKHQPTHR